MRHYLPNLQLRQKWHVETKPITVGCVVMLVDPQLPRARWLIGRVGRTFSGVDGHVRSVKVSVKCRLYVAYCQITEDDGTKSTDT